MIIDITGTILIPGNLGKDCPGNGENGNECCCDECNYFLYCFPQYDWRLKRNKFKKWLIKVLKINPDIFLNHL